MSRICMASLGEDSGFGEKSKYVGRVLVGDNDYGGRRSLRWYGGGQGPRTTRTGLGEWVGVIGLDGWRAGGIYWWGMEWIDGWMGGDSYFGGGGGGGKW